MNMHLVVADDQMQQHTFQRILTDFPPEREGFDEMIERMREGKDIDASSDGSWLDNDIALAGWILWAICDGVDEDGQLTKRRTILMGSTMLVDGRLDANTAFRGKPWVASSSPSSYAQPMNSYTNIEGSE